MQDTILDQLAHPKGRSCTECTKKQMNLLCSVLSLSIEWIPFTGAQTWSCTPRFLKEGAEPLCVAPRESDLIQTPEPQEVSREWSSVRCGHVTLNNWESHVSGVLFLVACVAVPLTVLDQQLRTEPWFSLTPEKDNVGAFIIPNIRKAEWHPKNKT